MIGDLVVDYKIYPDGKLRVKGFNKSNDNTQITTQEGHLHKELVFFIEKNLIL